MDYILVRYPHSGGRECIARTEPKPTLTIDPASAHGWPSLWDAKGWLASQPSPIRYRLDGFGPILRDHA